MGGRGTRATRRVVDSRPGVKAAVVPPSRNTETLPAGLEGGHRAGAARPGRRVLPAWHGSCCHLRESPVPMESHCSSLPKPRCPCRWRKGGRRKAFCRGSQTQSVAELVETLISVPCSNYETIPPTPQLLLCR